VTQSDITVDFESLFKRLKADFPLAKIEDYPEYLSDNFEEYLGVTEELIDNWESLTSIKKDFKKYLHELN
jgi:hypothetical protein